jgi:hypothetical protein
LRGHYKILRCAQDDSGENVHRCHP